MRFLSDCRARAFRGCLWCLGTLGLLLVAPAVACADESPAGQVVAVEEDWELIIKEPDQETQAPQVSCVMAPTSDDSGVFAAFNLNHKSFPQYDAGGLHLQLWNNQVALASATFPSDALLGTVNEAIRWTMQMRLENGQLIFEVVSGSSDTWGTFGGTGVLNVSVASELGNLDQYQPEYSVANSGVGYAGNRVTSLKLKAVRKLLESGQVLQDNNPRVVFPHD
jgi:hypothetical protein